MNLNYNAVVKATHKATKSARATRNESNALAGFWSPKRTSLQCGGKSSGLGRQRKKRVEESQVMSLMIHVQLAAGLDSSLMGKNCPTKL